MKSTMLSIQMNMQTVAQTLEMAAKLKSKREQESKKTKIIEDCKKGRKTDSDSLYTSIDKILQDYGIIRAAYHGGDLT